MGGKKRRRKPKRAKKLKQAMPVVVAPAQGRGRPSKLTPETQEKIIEGLRAGLPYAQACDLAGITDQTRRNWMERGQSEESGIYFDFLGAIKACEAEAMQTCLKGIQDAGKDPKQWRALAWILERRWPALWGDQKPEEKGQTGNVTVVFGSPDAPFPRPGDPLPPDPANEAKQPSPKKSGVISADDLEDL